MTLTVEIIKNCNLDHRIFADFQCESDRVITAKIACDLGRETSRRKCPSGFNFLLSIFFGIIYVLSQIDSNPRLHVLNLPSLRSESTYPQFINFYVISENYFAAIEEGLLTIRRTPNLCYMFWKGKDYNYNTDSVDYREVQHKLIHSNSFHFSTFQDHES
jgi:hypothetical protein